VKKEAFHFEIKDLLTQFIAAFDDVVIKRHNKKRQAKQEIEVRYVFAPKQRVMYDIINKAQNLTLPVVSVDLTNISRDETRVFNKIDPSYIPATRDPDPLEDSKFLMPVPVNLEINMSILARYMSDVDQIVSNFVPYNNPYIILSWKVPEKFGTLYTQEIRSEVLWSGNLSYNTPTETTYNDKFRITVDTSFIIKGWLFPENPQTSGTIYKVDADFIAVDLRNKIYNPLDSHQVVDNLTYEDQGYAVLSAYDSIVPTGVLSGGGFSNYSDNVTVSAMPEFTNIFWGGSGAFHELRGQTNININYNNNFIFYGKRFEGGRTLKDGSRQYNNSFYLSANVIDFLSGGTPVVTNYQSITSAKGEVSTGTGEISGYKLNTDFYTVNNDNFATVHLPVYTLSGFAGTGSTDTSGKFVLITANEAGWASSYQATSSIINIA